MFRGSPAKAVKELLEVLLGIVPQQGDCFGDVISVMHVRYGKLMLRQQVYRAWIVALDHRYGVGNKAGPVFIDKGFLTVNQKCLALEGFGDDRAKSQLVCLSYVLAVEPIVQPSESGGLPIRGYEAAVTQDGNIEFMLARIELARMETVLHIRETAW